MPAAEPARSAFPGPQRSNVDRRRVLASRTEVPSAKRDHPLWSGLDLARIPTDAMRPAAAFTSPVRSRGQLAHTRSQLKSERGPDEPTPTGHGKKGESDAGTGALIGGGIGAGAGAIIGGLFGGPLGMLLGAGIGALVGAGIGSLIGALVGGGISWQPEGYSAVAAGGSSTTVERPFVPKYRAVLDKAKKVWRPVVDSLEGGVDITVHTGGSRDPFSSPPTSQAKADAAVKDMKGYYARGSRGDWHTEAASRKHEEHHFREWRCSSEHYWPAAKQAIESITVPQVEQPTEAAALAAMRAGPAGADAKLSAFQGIARAYWMTLADNAGARPYAAGQRELNHAVTYVQALADAKHWVVPRGVTNPNTGRRATSPGFRIRHERPRPARADIVDRRRSAGPHSLPVRIGVVNRGRVPVRLLAEFQPARRSSSASSSSGTTARQSSTAARARSTSDLVSPSASTSSQARCTRPTPTWPSRWARVFNPAATRWRSPTTISTARTVSRECSTATESSSMCPRRDHVQGSSLMPATDAGGSA